MDWLAVLVLAVLLLLPACSGGGGGSAGGGPGTVTLTGATARTASIDLAWTNPAVADLDHIRIAWSLAGTPVDTLTGGAGSTSCTLADLAPSTEYAIALVAVDAAGRESAPAAFSLKTQASGEESYSFLYTVDDLDGMHGHPDGNGILMADLDLDVAPHNAGTGWAPIGSPAAPYAGIFYGNHHAIRNLHCAAAPGGSPAGLFGVLDGAVIRELGLVSVDLAADVGGGLAGAAANSILSDCSVGGTLAGTSSVGGLVGSASALVVDGCSSTATVVGEVSTGGLTGSAINSTFSQCTASGTVSGMAHTGGLAGYVSASQLSHCSAAGIVAGGAANLGGLVGYVEASTLTDCRATATVTGSGDCDGGLAGRCSGSTMARCSATGPVTGHQYAGGLVGYNLQSAITESFASGAVVGTSFYVGGLVGFNESSPITNSYARGAVSGPTMVGGFAGVQKCQSAACAIGYCFSTGFVSYSGDPGDNGGFVGYDWYGHDITRCYYDRETSGQSATGKGEPADTAWMKSIGWYEGWDFSNLWSLDDLGAINDGYPYLRNHTP